MRSATRAGRAVQVVNAARVNATSRHVSVGRGTRLRGGIVERGLGTVAIGPGCRIGLGVRPGQLIVGGPGRIVIGANCVIDAAEIHTLRADAIITIGDGTYLNRVEIAAVHSVQIGQRCEIGSALIYDTDFHSVERSPRGEVRSGPITIGDDVWIAARTAVLRGVHIGDRSIVGLGVVVSRDVDPDSVLRPAEPRLFR